jgi:16S rRNA (guanine966-N2)-methyltransferase
MRVIAGTYRSRRLIAPRGLATRPTSDRLRETLFNILATRIEGAVFADLYAPAVAAIRENLAGLEIRSGFKIESRSVSAALRRFSEPGLEERCTIVFLDPPYAAADDYSRTLTSIGQQADSLLTPNGIVIAEHGRKMQPPLAESFGPLHRYRVLEQGDAGLTFYGR